MSYYERKIKYYKSFRLIDTDGDNRNDTLVYKPYSNNYYLQIGMDQEIKNIGHYNLGVNSGFEIVDFSSIWGEDGSGIINDGGYTPPPLVNPQGTDDSTAPLNPSEFCSDETALNYQPLNGVLGFSPCPNNSCCQYVNIDNYTYGGGGGSGFNSLDCLTVYTDWGPWNDDLILNDTEQIYVTKNGSDCTMNFRLWNLDNEQPVSNADPSKQGGWYGASIKIEVDNGGGYQIVTPSSSEIIYQDNEITYDSNKGSFSLDEKVKIFLAKDGNFFSGNDSYSTKPFRDFTITLGVGSQIKITYLNPTNGVGSTADNLYQQKAKFLSLQIFKSDNNEILRPLEPDTFSSFSNPNIAQDLEWLTEPLFNGPSNLSPEGRTVTGTESFVFVTPSVNITAAENQSQLLWLYYHNGYQNPNNDVPWDAVLGSNTLPNRRVGNFYECNQEIIFSQLIPNLCQGPYSVQHVQTIGASLAGFQAIPSNGTSYIQNTQEEIFETTFSCPTNTNPVSYFDRDGDGFIEFDENYPTIDPSKPGSVDSGLFSRTRYDSPYIYVKPSVKGPGLTGFDDSNEIEQYFISTPNSSSQISDPSRAGWRSYKKGPYYYKTSPTCQLGGCDNQLNSFLGLIEPSNANIFLPQFDLNPILPFAGKSGNEECANFGTGDEPFFSWWSKLSNHQSFLFPNRWDALGGCCALPQNTDVVQDSQGPWPKSKCSRCHSELTSRSAQPVLDENTKSNMQDIGSDTYYGPFYDTSNPTYNGYGLAFSKANNFCRDKSKEVEVKTGTVSYQGKNLTINGGIIHGGVKVKNFASNFDLEKDINEFFEPFGGCGSVGFGSDPNEPDPILSKKCEEAKQNDPRCPVGRRCMVCFYCFKCI
jgi:hypothetical protein